MFNNIYKGKKVLVTGHTGFKGTWLTMWLLNLGAEVIGYSKNIPTEPSHFSSLKLQHKISHNLGDVRDFSCLKKIVEEEQPEIVFHLAAQPLVRESYKNPLETIETNTIGVANILEVARQVDGIKAIVIVTSDKCYDNVEWIWGYRENDKLGGEDPYSASKGCAELIAKTYMKSFFIEGDTYVATARAGNVIGGGDWALDRIVPDSMEAWANNKEVIIRSPYSTRPWQHVLEPLSGYLQLASELFIQNIQCKNQSFNFGPDANVNKTVEELLIQMKQNWESVNWRVEMPSHNKMKEACLLKLACDKANNILEWYTTLNFVKTVEMTVLWYKEFYNSNDSDIFNLSMNQIEDYCNIALLKGIKWTK